MMQFHNAGFDHSEYNERVREAGAAAAATRLAREAQAGQPERSGLAAWVLRLATTLRLRPGFSR